MILPPAQLETFRANMWLLICALLLLGLAVVVILVTSTVAKMGLWRRRRRHAVQQQAREKRRPDGPPYPPAGRGLCDRCRRVYEKVYHLPSGERRCPACYEALLKEPR